MALCSAVITTALKKLGIAVPTSTEISDGLPYLQGLYDQLASGGTFGRTHDVVVTADYTAREFDRIYVDTASAVIITVPDTFDRLTADPAPLDGDQNTSLRPGRELSIIVVVDGYSNGDALLIRDGYQADWVNATTLALTDDAPLAGRDYDGLCCLLAMRLADEYSDRPPNPTTISGAGRFMSALTNKFSAERRETAVDYF